jgi:hypothetical protein
MPKNINTNEGWVQKVGRRLRLVAVVRLLLLKRHLELGLPGKLARRFISNFLLFKFLDLGKVLANFSHSYICNILMVSKVTFFDSLFAKLARLSLINHLFG